MRLSALRPKSTPAGWLALYEPIAAELAAAEELLHNELRSDDPLVDKLVSHAYQLGGKRLRPALLLLAARATGNVNQDHVLLSTVVEMIHTATLVHDDVLDEADLRRHRQTMNALFDNEASVLVGDFLFTHAFALASSLDTTYGCRVIGKATNIVCAGELRQVHSRGNFALSEAEYLDIIEAKTAELTACCCRLGAHYAGAAPEIEESLDRYGRNLGIAFQIADDVLDVVGDEQAAGKSLGTDFEKQKPTLPIIRLLATVDEPERAKIVSQFQSDRPEVRRALGQRLLGSEALKYAQGRAQAFATQALEELASLPASPAKQVLSQLTRLVVSRRE